MKVLEAKFVQDFITMCNDGWLQGWHERNGGNASYRIPEAEVESIREDLSFDAAWTPIGTDVPGLAGEFFLITGSGKATAATKNKRLIKSEYLIAIARKRPAFL